jgi:hypothetical protein
MNHAVVSCIERLIPNSSLLRVRCEPVAVSRVSALGVIAVLVESARLGCFVGSVKKKKKSVIKGEHVRGCWVGVR